MEDSLKELKELMTMIYNSNIKTSEKGALVDKAEKVGIAFIEEKYEAIAVARSTSGYDPIFEDVLGKFTNQNK
jgi:hypothetical protein